MMICLKLEYGARLGQQLSNDPKMFADFDYAAFSAYVPLATLPYFNFLSFRNTYIVEIKIGFSFLSHMQPMGIVNIPRMNVDN